MSWLYLPSSCFPESECSAKASEQDLRTWASAIAPVSTLSGKLTQPQSWLRAWKKARWMRHLSGPTLPPLMQQHGAERWIASLPDSHVKTSLLLGAVQDLTASAPDCSSKSHGSPTIAVRGSSFWRTSQASLLPPPPLWTKPKASSTSVRPPESWENWPTAGGTRNGSLFLRPTWEQIMAGRGGSASRGVWMTPNVPNGGRHVPPELVESKGMTEDGQKRTVGLESQSKYWATPDCNTATYSNGRFGPNIRQQSSTWTTPTATERSGQGERNKALILDVKNWPTPQSSDEKRDRGSMEQKLRWSKRPNASSELAIDAALWPTPAARDHKGTNSQQHMNRTDGRTDGRTQEPCRSITEFHHDELFAPGPSDAQWAGIIARFPWLAPALSIEQELNAATTFSEAQSILCGMADGMAEELDFDHRAGRLKCCGNGVVPLCAAVAFVVLARRAGIFG